MFSFEKLDVYQRSLSYFRRVDKINKRIKGRVSYSLLDQLSRASLSISLNIAEGSGRWHKKEKQRFFWIARGSVFEVVPIFQILKESSLITEVEHTDFYNLLEELSKMLLGLIHSLDK